MRATALSLMLWGLAAPMLAPLMAPAAATAQVIGDDLPPAAAEARAAIEGVIAGQLQAFADRDVAAAWGHASPFIQTIFGSPDNFGAMVEQGYPMVWSNAGASFSDLRTEGTLLLQRLVVEDAEGRFWTMDYEMVQVDGDWRINGVLLLPAPDLSA